MDTRIQRIARIANLEWANYAATLATAQVTPGLDLFLRDDVIITGSEVFPSPDVNHACLLRATPQTVDSLIVEVIDYFRSKGLPTTIFISPACTPSDLPGRLLEQGFVKQEAEEAWMVLSHLLDFEIPSPSPRIVVRQITRNETLTFARTFVTAFDIPVDLAPCMAQLLEPSVELPSVYHYVALFNDQPVGVCSLLRYENFGVLGSAGVVPAHRGSGAATSLAIKAATEAQKQGVDVLMLQTTAGTWLERLLSMSGFEQVFTRICYILP